MPKEKKEKKNAKTSKKQFVAVDDLKSVVKDIVHKQIENKHIKYSVTTILNYINGPTFTTANIFQLTPSNVASGYQIIQGVGQGNRVGNRISVRKAILKVLVHPSVYDATTNNAPIPHDIVMYIFGLKQQVDQFSLAQTTCQTTFYQNGDSSVGMTSLSTDLMLAVNRDRVTPYYQRILKVGNAAYTGSGNQAAYQFMSNNDYKYKQMKTIDITKHFPKNIIWNDTNTLSLQKGVYIAFNCIPANGTSPVANQLTNTATFNLDLEFEDA